MGILNQDYVSWLRTSSLSTIIWIYTLIFKLIYLLQKYSSLKQMKQTTHQVSCQSLLNHENFSAGLYIKQGPSWGSLQRFSSSSLQLNRSIILILLLSELMEREPRRHLVQNCLHSTFAVEQLHCLCQWCFFNSGAGALARQRSSIAKEIW